MIFNPKTIKHSPTSMFDLDFLRVFDIFGLTTLPSFEAFWEFSAPEDFGQKKNQLRLKGKNLISLVSRCTSGFDRNNFSEGHGDSLHFGWEIGEISFRWGFWFKDTHGDMVHRWLFTEDMHIQIIIHKCYIHTYGLIYVHTYIYILYTLHTQHISCTHINYIYKYTSITCCITIAQMYT